MHARAAVSAVVLVVAVVVRPWVLQHFSQSPASDAAGGSSPPDQAARPPVPDAPSLDGSVWGEDWHVERLKQIMVSPWSTLNASKVSVNTPEDMCVVRGALVVPH